MCGVWLRKTKLIAYKFIIFLFLLSFSKFSVAEEPLVVTSYGIMTCDQAVKWRDGSGFLLFDTAWKADESGKTERINKAIDDLMVHKDALKMKLANTESEQIDEVVFEIQKAVLAFAIGKISTAKLPDSDAVAMQILINRSVAITSDITTKGLDKALNIDSVIKENINIYKSLALMAVGPLGVAIVDSVDLGINVGMVYWNKQIDIDSLTAEDEILDAGIKRLTEKSPATIIQDVNSAKNQIDEICN